MKSAREGWASRIAFPVGLFKAMPDRLGAPVGVLCALVCLALPAAAQAPDEDWRTLETEHFRVTFPAGLEALARRAAARAETARARLEAAFVEAPGGTVDILLSDHTDIPNGFARVSPSNRIAVFAQPPVDDPNLGYFDEWMELVVTHELAHIYHLDRTGVLGRIARSIVGRYPATWPVFPNQAAPRWTIEGLATWYESRLSDAGREHGTFQEAMLRTAILEDRFESLDQASGDSPVWPGGTRAYTYGSEFFDYLLERHGQERMATFVDAVARQWIPYRLNAAGSDAFGEPVDAAWTAWSDSLRARWADLDADLARLGPVTDPEVVVRAERVAHYAKASPDGSVVAYARSDGRSDTQIREVRADGSGSRKRARSSGLATFDWLPGGDLLAAQFEQDGPYRVYSDLYRVAPDGTETRLTVGARLQNPSVAPDGTAVAVQNGGGTTTLVRVQPDGSFAPLVAAEPGVHWAYPAVSPDGRWIAASRWTPGGYLDVVVLDASGREVARVTDDRAMDLAPAWGPDGRWLVWGSDRTGIPNILAAPVDPATGRPGTVRLASNVRTAVAYPDVDPAGRWIWMSGYHADGWGIERIPFTPDSWPEAPPVDPRFTAEGPPPDPSDAAGGPVRGYSPFPTLLPRYWEPLLEEPLETVPVRTDDGVVPGRQLLGYRVGAEISGFDLVGRHNYSASVRVPVDAVGRADLGASYSFFGLGNPTLGLSACQLWGTDGVRLVTPDGGGPPDTLFVLDRTRSVSGSVTWRHQTIRTTLALTASAGLAWEDRQLLDNALEPATGFRLTTPDRRTGDTRLSLNWSRARSHALQMGPANGPAGFVRLRRVHDLSVPDSLNDVLGEDGSVDEVLGELRMYRTIDGPGFASHVLLARVGAGYARGPAARSGWFRVGGASGTAEDITGFELFGGTPVFFGVRGYDRSTRFGRAAWAATLEYRVPLRVVHRGAGAWPAYMDRVFASVFLDAGNAWGPEFGQTGFQNPRRSSLAGAGAEVMADFLTFWTEGIRIRAGVAAPLVDGDGVVGYVRVGLPF